MAVIKQNHCHQQKAKTCFADKRKENDENKTAADQNAFPVQRSALVILWYSEWPVKDFHHCYAFFDLLQPFDSWALQLRVLLQMAQYNRKGRGTTEAIRNSRAVMHFAFSQLAPQNKSPTNGMT